MGVFVERPVTRLRCGRERAEGGEVCQLEWGHRGRHDDRQGTQWKESEARPQRGTVNLPGL